jgi:hypothetical protein
MRSKLGSTPSGLKRKLEAEEPGMSANADFIAGTFCPMRDGFCIPGPLSTLSID